jgi:hypothetical protein
LFFKLPLIWPFTLYATKHLLMGQLNFFMTEHEIVNELNDLLLSNNFILFNKAFFTEEVPEPINSITNLNEIDKLTIWVKNSQSEPTCSSKGKEDHNGMFLFDTYKDPVIDLHIGRTIDKTISPTRLYYKTGWIANEELRDLHAKAINKIVRTFKKKLITTNRLKRFYMSHTIIKRLEDGYEVELGKGGMRVTKLNLSGI